MQKKLLSSRIEEDKYLEKSANDSNKNVGQLIILQPSVLLKLFLGKSMNILTLVIEDLLRISSGVLAWSSVTD